MGRESEYLVDVANNVIEKLTMLKHQVGNDTDVKEVQREMAAAGFDNLVHNRMSQANTRVCFKNSKYGQALDDNEEEMATSEKKERKQQESRYEIPLNDIYNC